MEDRCPFCWGQDVRPVAAVEKNGSSRGRDLLECLSCEKWYWKDSRREVRELALLCVHQRNGGAVCRQVVLHPHRKGGYHSPRSKIIEFNHVCSECSLKRFAL